MNVLLPSGDRIQCLSRPETLTLYRQIFDQRVYLRNGIVLSEGDVVFDVGANVGLFSLFLARTLRDFTVYGIEPIPATFEALRRNTRRLGERVKLFNVGLSDHCGEAPFAFFPHCSCCSTRIPAASDAARRGFKSRLMGLTWNAAPGRRRAWDRALNRPMSLLADLLVSYCFRHTEVICRLTTLSQLIRDNNVDLIDLLKLDAEGSEWDILHGVEERHWPRIRQVVLEVHPFDSSSDRIDEYLCCRGFSTSIIQDDDSGSMSPYILYGTR